MCYSLLMSMTVLGSDNRVSTGSSSGTWTQSKEHERMIRSTQRKMLRLTVQTKRKYKKKTQPRKNEEDEEEEKANHRSSDDETVEGSSSNTDCDQVSDISFMEDTDEEVDTAEIDEEDWIKHMKRSTSVAVERMKTAKIRCWSETHRRMQWRLGMRIASLPDKRWTKKAAKWNSRQTEQWDDQKSDGKMKYMTSSSQRKPRRRKAKKFKT